MQHEFSMWTYCNIEFRSVHHVIIGKKKIFFAWEDFFLLLHIPHMMQSHKHVIMHLNYQQQQGITLTPLIIEGSLIDAANNAMRQYSNIHFYDSIWGRRQQIAEQNVVVVAFYNILANNFFLMWDFIFSSSPSSSPCHYYNFCLSLPLAQTHHSQFSHRCCCFCCHCMQ